MRPETARLGAFGVRASLQLARKLIVAVTRSTKRFPDLVLWRQPPVVCLVMLMMVLLVVPAFGAKPKEIEAAYRSALSGISEDLDGTAQRIADWEAELVGTGKKAYGEQQKMRDAQVKVLAQLARANAELLLPVISLHIEIRAIHATHTRFELLGSTSRFVSRAAELYAERSSFEHAPRVAADLLGRLGAQLLAESTYQGALNSFSLACSLDPGHAPAHLGRGIVLEKRARYLQATEALDRAVAAQPDLAEARLRLAINLARVEQEGEALRQLETLRASDAPAWVKALGYQELARLHGRRDRPDVALQVLQEAVSAVPNSTKLNIQLAHYAERVRRQDIARRSIDAVKSLAAEVDEPRDRYNRPSDLMALGPHRDAVQAHIDEQLGLIPRTLTEAGR